MAQHVFDVLRDSDSLERIKALLVDNISVKMTLAQINTCSLSPSKELGLVKWIKNTFPRKLGVIIYHVWRLTLSTRLLAVYFREKSPSEYLS